MGNRSSLIVFPFKSEPADILRANLSTAASHPRITEVWAVGTDRDATTVETLARGVEDETGTTVKVFPQKRIGRYRAGKGDGINTALRRAHDVGYDRVHFYDADITNFDHTWIDGGEAAADRGYLTVRHRFPRAATDAMITWMITRPSLAMIFPGTLLPRIGQPLGGEIVLASETVERLITNPLVGDRSDWGIDTVLTYASSRFDEPIYEHHVADGKRHALYGSLDEIRTMVVECLDAVQSLQGLPTPGASLVSDPPAPVPDDLKTTVGYDLDRTLDLLTGGWTHAERELAATVPEISAQVLNNQIRPHFDYMDASRWGEILKWLLSGFRLGDPAWESLAFRLWLIRVVSYTTTEATHGYDHAIGYLERTIATYEQG